MSSAQVAAECRRMITVTGTVQGVGFRPFVYRVARAESLRGWVRNDAGAVRIAVAGPADAVARFTTQLHNGPPQARVARVVVAKLPRGELAEWTAFEICPSEGGAPLAPAVPPDLATCAECAREIRTPGQRRYGYPFTNCTNCGPRWSIIKRTPYDRPQTTMSSFAMCPSCEREYVDPSDRRFHAQPIACPTCGPQAWLADPAGRRLAGPSTAVADAAQLIQEGKIVALQGLCGFQLVCDATNEAAVVRLRARKRRPDKPLAVMAAAPATVHELCRMSPAEQRHWLSPAAPILLLRRRERSAIAPSVAPANLRLGVMAPAAPLHHLLLDAVARPLVCTSGNLAEEPMAIDLEDAVARLGDVADGFLAHDRPIRRAVDDSVARVDGDVLRILRRARGFAPTPLEAPSDVHGIVAVGGRLKNTVAVGVGGAVVMSPHIGDLDDARSIALHEQVLEDLIAFHGLTPRLVACDAHPDYESTRSAERIARRWSVPLLPVQHHHAHVAACLAEHSTAAPALGLAWDGAGWGIDGTVWGGEALVCRRGDCQRVGWLRPLPLAGGDRAARDPCLPAVALLQEVDPNAAREFIVTRRPREAAALLTALRTPRLAPATTSMGRLFDGVAALVGCDRASTYEGQPAMALQDLAERADNDDGYPMPVVGGPPWTIDWRPAVAATTADLRRGRPPEEVARSFHAGLAAAAAQIARRAGCDVVALTGGCFQNALLARLVRTELRTAGFRVLEHAAVPPGDGGIALGQVMVAAYLSEDQQIAVPGLRVDQSFYMPGTP